MARFLMALVDGCLGLRYQGITVVVVLAGVVALIAWLVVTRGL